MSLLFAFSSDNGWRTSLDHFNLTKGQGEEKREKTGRLLLDENLSGSCLIGRDYLAAMPIHSVYWERRRELPLYTKARAGIRGLPQLEIRTVLKLYRRPMSDCFHVLIDENSQCQLGKRLIT